MAKVTVAEELVKQLNPLGVKQIFGTTGEALNAVTNAIRSHGGIEWFTVRHQETAAFAACAQAEITGELAVCADTIGPGALHLINGLHNAKRHRFPVLAITGQVPRMEHEGAYFQKVDIDKAFDDVCIFNRTLRSEAQFPRILQQAISAAVNQKGVAHIAIPTDITLTKISPTAPIKIISDHQVLLPCETKLNQLAEKIKKAESVSLLIGRGCRDTREEVSQLATLINSPVAHSLT